MPASVIRFPRRPAWAESVEHYAQIIQATLPALRSRLDHLVADIEAGMKFVTAIDEPTHGDFHEGQLMVAAHKVVGMLDVDTVGPGSKVDDIACLVAHLSTIQHMNVVQTERVHRIIQEWVPVFDNRFDPVQLRLRAAAVIISLATGPFRSQEPNWERETTRMVGSAEALVRQVM